MEFICYKEKLDKAINIVQKAVSSRSTLPILEGILIECGENIKLTGNDLEIGIECIMDANIIEEGSVVLNSRILGDIVKRVPGEEIRVKTTENNTAHIESGYSHFEINGIAAEGYPEIPVIKKENAFEIKQKTFRDIIRQTVFAVSVDETRPILTGSLLECNSGTVTMVSCDSYRVALRRKAIENEDFDISMVIPGRILSEVSKILEDGEEEMCIYSTRSQVQFDMGEYKLVSRLLEGEYFKYGSFIPEEYETRVVIERQKLLSSLERASIVIVTDERRYPVNLKIAENEIVIQSITSLGSARDVLEAEIDGNDIEIRFNPRYFMEALKAIEDEVIEVCFTNDVGPCVIKPLEGDEYVYLIVPLRK